MLPDLKGDCQSEAANRSSKIKGAPGAGRDQKRVKMEVKARMDLGFHNNLDLHVPQSSIQAKVPFAHSPILI